MPTSSNAKGRLIVIDGTDGTGKTTQTKLLVTRLRAAGKKVAIADFPRYGLPSAYFVEQYLNGRYGAAATVDPHAASLFYALDRYDAKRMLLRELAAGKIVVSNRYVSANMGHQGGKITNASKRREFFRWLDWLEHDLLGLPRPDKTILLHVPAAMAQRLVDRKGRRDYIRRKRDIHEADLGHLKAAEQTFLTMAKQFSGFSVINCIEKQQLLTPLEVHEKIWDTVRTIV
ncbi:MAG: type IV secretion system DNA-binding domain-containing protein [Patescibacteria group bacterium]|jgi:dTMP kinase